MIAYFTYSHLLAIVRALGTVLDTENVFREI